MITRRHGYLETLRGDAPAPSMDLERDGYAVLRSVLEPDEAAALARDIARVFAETPQDDRPAAARRPEQDMFRYEMLNRSPACQRVAAHPRILETIEPLLGEDCHVIANTAWRNPSGLGGSERGEFWHIDAGPHVPRPAGVPWPDEIPYPVFAIGCHILLSESRIEDGPTGVIPRSHRSGQHPPFDRIMDADLELDGERCLPLLGGAGDVLLFVSDVWHRRMPTLAGERGRFFLQVHYGRRDIAQRLRTTAQSNQLTPEAEARADTQRARALVGRHAPGFYDG